VINEKGETAITDWIFNGWGDRFPYDLDDKVPLPLPKVHQTSTMTDWRKSTLADAACSDYSIANNVVLVPVYGHANDQRALKILAEHFPDREITGIEVVALIEHGGAIGCVTQPQPMPLKR